MDSFFAAEYIFVARMLSHLIHDRSNENAMSVQYSPDCLVRDVILCQSRSQEFISLTHIRYY